MGEKVSKFQQGSASEYAGTRSRTSYFCEYSLLVHMKPGSVMVKAGDPVKSGQLVGRIGFAGDSIFPHLHYSLMEGSEVFKAWGLPAYFLHFHRVLGAQSLEVNRGPIDSGDFLESDAMYLDPE